MGSYDPPKPEVHYTAHIKINRTTRQDAKSGTLAAVGDGTQRDTVVLTEVTVRAGTYNELTSKLRAHVELIEASSE